MKRTVYRILGNRGNLVLMPDRDRESRDRVVESRGSLLLMTECPLNSQCVDRNFCDNKGFITTRRNNRLSFEEDKRDLIVSSIFSLIIAKVILRMDKWQITKINSEHQIKLLSGRVCVFFRNTYSFLNPYWIWVQERQDSCQQFLSILSIEKA